MSGGSQKERYLHSNGASTPTNRRPWIKYVSVLVRGSTVYKLQMLVMGAKWQGHPRHQVPPLKRQASEGSRLCINCALDS